MEQDVVIKGKQIHIVTCLTEGRRYYATLLSLLGNRSRNSSMDTLTTPVLLRAWLPTVAKSGFLLGRPSVI
jgi:hypothetical protein